MGQVGDLPVHGVSDSVRARDPAAGRPEGPLPHGLPLAAYRSYGARRSFYRGAVAERFRIVAVEHLFIEANLAGLGIHRPELLDKGYLNSAGSPQAGVRRNRNVT